MMKTRLLALLMASASSAALAASAPVLVNPSFQQSDSAGGLPAGWTAFGAHVEARTECASTCALHLQSREGGGQPGGVYQQVAPGSAAGYRLILSGRIRTENLQGSAVLAARVLSDAGNPSDHANGPAAPNGTSEWRRFELVVPVPANATSVILGAGVSGKGAAWIDSLELKVDESVRVAAVAPTPPPVAPPRPVPSQQLLDDAALRVEETAWPAIPSQWRTDVLARRHPVRSLFSEDFSDLQFLKPLLKGKRVVQLGEAAHGVAESNWAKVRLIKFLHQEMGFDVVAFEGSIDQCFEADKQIGSVAPREVMAQCLYPIWRTNEVSGLFDYLGAVRKSGKPIALAGFDIQFSGSRADKASLSSMLPIADASLAARLDEFEGGFRTGTAFKPAHSASIQAFYGQVATALGARREALRQAGHGPADIEVGIQVARARSWLARQYEHLDVPNSMDGNAVRDAGMAEQLDFLLDVLYPKRKVIVWAHNMHVTNAHAPGDFTSMGEVLARRRRAEMYTVGFYMGRGMVSNGHQAPWPVATPPADTLEGVLANGGVKYAFVDFLKADRGSSTTWFTKENTVREFGTVPKKIVPAQSYDGIFYIDTVTPAEKY